MSGYRFLLGDEFFIFEDFGKILHHDSISLAGWMDAIILIETYLECDSIEEEVHIDEIIFSGELGEHGFVLLPICTPEIEWCFHTCEEYWDIFGLEFFYDGSDIGLDIGDGLTLEGIVSTDTEDSKTRSLSLEEPIHTREESSARIA